PAFASRAVMLRDAIRRCKRENRSPNSSQRGLRSGNGCWYLLPDMINPGLQDQTAVVTGGNSGIGAAIAKALAEQGVRVAIHYYPGALFEGALHTVLGGEAAERLAEEIRRDGGNAITVGKDLSEPDAAA